MAEVKYSNSGFISTNIIDKAVDRLISYTTKQDDEKIIPVLIVNGKASEELKNTKDLLVIDIANILYLVKDNQTKDLWNTITRYFNSKYIVFEFKNYKSQITQKDIYIQPKNIYI